MTVKSTLTYSGFPRLGCKPMIFCLTHVYIGDVKCDVACNIASIITFYLLTLANRNYPICVKSSKVAEASTVVDCHVSLLPTVSLTNVANVNIPLLSLYLGSLVHYY